MDVGLYRRDFVDLEKKMEAGFMSSAILERHSSGHGLAMPSWTVIPILYHAPPHYEEAGIRVVTFPEANIEKRKYTMQDQYGSTWQIDADKLAQHKEVTVAVLKHASDGLSAMKSLKYSDAVGNFDAALKQRWECHRDTLLELWIKVHQGHALLRAGLLQCPAIHGQNTCALLERSRETLWHCQCVLRMELNPAKQHLTPHAFNRSLLFSSLLGLAWFYFFRGDTVKAKEYILDASTVKLDSSHLRADRDIDTVFLRLALERVTGNLHGTDKWLSRFGNRLSNYDEDVFLVGLLDNEYADLTSQISVPASAALYSTFRPEYKFLADLPEPSVKKLLEQLEAGYLGNMWLAAGARNQAKVAYDTASTSESLLLQAAAMVGLGNIIMRDRVVKPLSEASPTANESELGFAAAEKKYKGALQIYDMLGYKEAQIIVQCNLGNLYHKRGQLGEALEGYQNAMTYFTREMKKSLAALHLHLKFAELYLDKENLDEAFKSIQEAANILTTSYPMGKAWVEQLYGTFYLKRSGVTKSKDKQSSDLSNAQCHLCTAVKCFAEIQNSLRPFWSSLSITVFEQQKETYALLLWCLACQQKTSPIEALVWSERSRSRTSVVERLDSFSQNLGEYLSDEAVFEAFLATASGKFDNLTWEESWKNLQSLLCRCRLSTGTVVVEYVLCADSGYLIFVLDLPGGRPKMKRVSFAEQKLNGKKLDRGELNELVNDTNRKISRLDSKSGKNEEVETSLASLYEILIKPVEQWLGKSEHVVVIPHEVLFKVPFHALIDGNKKFLIEKYTLSCAESIRNLVQCSLRWEERIYSPQGQNLHNNSLSTSKRRKWLVVGINKHEPFARDLKLAEEEATEIASMEFEPSVTIQRLLGSEATKEQIKSRLADADVIHLATHGIISPKYESGGILFVVPAELENVDSSADIVGVERAYGATESAEMTARSLYDLCSRWNDNRSSAEKLVLSANEISIMHLKAQLVVLSACQSAEGVILGEGVAGLGRALLRAGVPSTVLSLWPVSDKTTVDFMKAFYAELARGRSVADAMRIAMVTMINAKQTFSEKPKYSVRQWAAFWSFGLPVVRLQGQELQSEPPRSQLTDKAPSPLRASVSMAVGAAATLALVFFGQIRRRS